MNGASSKSPSTRPHRAASPGGASPGGASPGGVRWLGYIPQLFVFTILPLTLLLVAIAFGSVAIHQDAMRDMAGEQDLRLVRSTAGALGEQFRLRHALLHELALRMGGLDESALASGEILEDDPTIQEIFDGGLALYTRTATAASPSDSSAAGGGSWKLAAASQEPSWEGVDPALVEPLLNSLPETGPETASTHFSPVFHNPSTGEMTILAAAHGGPNRALVGAISAGSLARPAMTGLSSGHMAGQPVDVTLLDREGVVLYHTGSPAGSHTGGAAQSNPDGVLDRPGFREALRGESGITYTRANGSELVVAFSPVEPLGWALVTEQPWEAIASPMLRTTQATPLVLVPGLLLAMVGLWFGARQVIQPLKNLENRAIQLAWGRYAAIRQPVGGIYEIQRLQAALVETARKVEAAQENLHSYIGAITAGQEEERRRLAREIHDDTLQAVIALNQRVQLARLSLNEPAGSGPVPLEPISDSLGEIQELTEQTIRNLRRLTRALRPAYLEELGLVPALRMLAQEASQASPARRDTPEAAEPPAVPPARPGDGFQVHFECQGEERRLKPEVELALYRMAQEALSNVQRHAQATQAWVSIAFDPNQVELRVRDDGRGFRVPDHPGDFVQAGHFGLLGLSERADLIGADLSLHSSPGKGTQVAVHINA